MITETVRTHDRVITGIQAGDNQTNLVNPGTYYDSVLGPH